MYAFVFWCEDVIFVISPRESQRPPTTSLTVVLSPSSKISCWQHCQFSWSEPLERITKKAIFRNLGQNYITYIANSSWGGIGSIPWKSECPVVVFSALLLAEIGTAAVMPKTGFPVRETITEKNVVGVTYDFLDLSQWLPIYFWFFLIPSSMDVTYDSPSPLAPSFPQFSLCTVPSLFTH